MSRYCKNKPEGLTNKYRDGTMLCGVTGCYKNAKTMGMCMVHRNGYEDTGVVGSVRDKRFHGAEIPRCANYPKCDRFARNNGYCNRCYSVIFRQRNKTKKTFASVAVGLCECKGYLLKYQSDAYCINCGTEYNGPDYQTKKEYAWT